MHEYMRAPEVAFEELYGHAAAAGDAEPDLWTLLDDPFSVSPYARRISEIDVRPPRQNRDPLVCVLLRLSERELASLSAVAAASARLRANCRGLLHSLHRSARPLLPSTNTVQLNKYGYRILQ